MFFSARSPRSSKVGFQPPGNGITDVREITMPPAGASASKPRRHVHAVAIEVVAIDDQVAQVQAHPEHKRSVLRLVAVGLGHGLLELDGGAQRIHGAGELDQRPVAGQLDQTPSAISSATGSSAGSDGSCEARKGPALVTPHQAGVADNVCSKDCRQFALLTRQRHSPWIVTESVGLLCEPGNRSGR